MKCSIILTLTILPIIAPTFPIKAGNTYSSPWDIINVVTISPIPKDVPILHKAGIWYFLKYLVKDLSLLNEIIAGLSDK